MNIISIRLLRGCVRRAGGTQSEHERKKMWANFQRSKHTQIYRIYVYNSNSGLSQDKTTIG